MRPAIEADLEVNRFAFSEQSGLQSADDGRYKLISDRDSGAQSLFDLRVDPGELSDRSSDLPAIRAELRAALDGWTQISAQDALKQADQLEERLRAIGYLE